MRKANELIGKSILNQGTGERLATVKDLVFETDMRRVAAIVVDSGGWFREARVICWESVASIGDAVLVRGADPITRANEAPQLADELRQDVRITGTPIVTETGERIGVVGDLYIDDTGLVIGYEVTQGFFSDLGGRKILLAEHVHTVGKDAIIADSGPLTSLNEVRSTLEQGGTASGSPVAPLEERAVSEPLPPTTDRDRSV